jgi:hypothetical protein
MVSVGRREEESFKNVAFVTHSPAFDVICIKVRLLED